MKLAEQLKGKVEFGKLDVTLYTEFSSKYMITHYPTLSLFHSGVDLPITYHGQRSLEDLKKWIQEQAQFTLPLFQKPNNNTVVFHGSEDSPAYKLVKVIALRDRYKQFAREPLKDEETTEYISWGGWKSSTFDLTLEEDLRKQSAGLLDFGEEAWLSIFHKSKRRSNLEMNGVFFINQNNNDVIVEYLRKVARDNPNIVFTHIEVENQ